LPLLALVDLLALLACAVILSIVFHRVRPVAGWLLLPYLAWLVFAAVLNAWIVYLN
jgi:benzodiazapine receptor